MQTTPNRSRLLLVMVLTLGSKGLAAESETTVRIVPFQRAPSPYVVIPVPIKGRGCTSLLLDTGTNVSILDPNLASGLTRADAGAITIGSAAGQTKGRMEAVSGIGFALSPEEAPPRIVAADVAALRELVGSVTGIFGQSLLGRSDYYIDYKTRRLAIGSAGTLAPDVSGARLPLEWSEGRPAIRATARVAGGDPVAVRLVLDSGVDRVTLFGAVARRLASAAASSSMVTVAGPLGSTRAPAASAVISASNRDKAVRATLMVDVNDRQEDGLLPTSLYRSVFVSPADGVIVLDGVLRASRGETLAGVSCSN